ncbi:lipopolysaccharide biosynthesis protein [Streptomyces sp. HPF1205]|uniref:lipopolysaccharide biosynthesis protein n=1 Tax=Streptomyces sp. HPF1205 TaxID=2873262 RepID=UPI001CEC0454|nr:lipopolysaccharide biosynthesis protein [Streptomyces sp. HPF1205]
MTGGELGGGPGGGPGGLPPDEPDLLREQFRQLLRYRALIAAGLLIGLIGGALLALSGADSYSATSDVMVRAATADPFATGATADKGINIGTERQNAMSSAVADAAAARVKQPAVRLTHCLRVTNPPNTLVLRFTCTTGDAHEAADWVDALTSAYLGAREAQTRATITRMISGYRAQLTPLVRQRSDLLTQIQRAKSVEIEGTLVSEQTNLLSRITELNGDISGLKALDTTPGVVIRPGVAPASPSGPGLPVLVGMGGALGIALGLLAAWVRLVFDPSVRSESEVARALDAPVLGTLPRTRRDPGELLAEGDGRLAEEYRAVAFRIGHDKRFAARRRLLVVAPRGPGDAAAGVAVNVSASFAEMGMEVLLVEADLRAPSLSARLRTAQGVRPAWARGTGPAEGGWPGGLHVPIDAGDSGSFDLVPGRRVRNVARALTSAPATRLFDEADEPGSAVVVLAPPVLAYADALALADRVDGVVVVCDPRAVHRADLVRVRELVEGAGGSVLGAVLHGAEPGAGGRFSRFTRSAGPGSGRAGGRGTRRRDPAADGPLPAPLPGPAVPGTPGDVPGNLPGPPEPHPVP